MLYYAFGVLVVPVEHDLRLSRWQVTAAFSAALLVSAVLAPAVGWLLDRGQGRALFRWGTLVGGFALIAGAAFPGLTSLQLTWGLAGVAMAATLYDAAFGVVTQLVPPGVQRLRATAIVTIGGGLASTFFIPLTSILVHQAGWRLTVGILATLLMLVDLVVSRFIPWQPRSAVEPVQHPVVRLDGRYYRLLLVFATASAAASACAAHLVPALIQAGLTSGGAAGIAALTGLSQLPGRLAVMSRLASHPPRILVGGSLLIQATGLGTLAAGRSTPSAALGVVLFGCGVGLATLVRPHLVHSLFGTGDLGLRIGFMTAGQRLGSAAGPLLGTWIGAAGGYSGMFGWFAASLAVPGVLLMYPARRNPGARPPS